MSYQTVAVSVLVVWLLTGIVLGVVMARRGYGGFGWGVLGAVFGPLGILLALFFHMPPKQDLIIRAGIAGEGPVDVLVGIDGSPSSTAAAIAVGRIVGSRLGRLTLATVEPIDASPEDETAGRNALEGARADFLRLHGDLSVRPEHLVLHGPAAEALVAYAEEAGYELIAVGSHGRGASAAVVGSTAGRLARSSPVPVVLAGQPVEGRASGGRGVAATSSGEVS